MPGRTCAVAYHDLREDEEWPNGLRVSVTEFKRHLMALSRVGTFVAPEDLESLEAGRTGLRLLLTFDDGYTSWVRSGIQIVASMGVPALFFLSTHNMTTGEPYWFDRVIASLTVRREEKLDLSDMGLGLYRFAWNDESRGWDRLHALLEDLKTVGNASEPRLAKILDRLDRLGGEEARALLARRRPLNCNEARKISGERLCRIGSHGHRHDILTRLSPGEIRSNLAGSKKILEELIGRPVTDVAYPNGAANSRVVEEAIATGYSRGFLATAGTWKPGADLYRIPRLLVNGYDSAARVVARLSILLVKSIRADAKRKALHREA